MCKIRGYTKNRGFTLVEILLVLGIISLIASLILIVTTKAREKARIAKLLQFSANVNHALGAYLLAEWKFEESGDNTCSNPGLPEYNDFCDTSGNGYHGRNTQVTRAQNDEISELGKAGYFSGGAHIEVSPVVSDSGFITIEAWVKPEEISTYELESRWIVANWSGYWFYIRKKKLCFLFPQPFCSSDVFEAGKWYHVMVTWGKSEVKLFVDAQMIASMPTDGDPLVGAMQYIGSGFPLGGPFKGFKGYIDQVRIYSQPLTSSQIKKLYVEGAKQHGFLANFQELIY